jgi:hypothetical protein
MRAWWWPRIKESLLDGAIDKDTRLATDLAGPAVNVDKEEMESAGSIPRMTETLWLSRRRPRYCHRKNSATRKNSRTSIPDRQRSSQLGRSPPR